MGVNYCFPSPTVLSHKNLSAFFPCNATHVKTLQALFWGVGRGGSDASLPNQVTFAPHFSLATVTLWQLHQEVSWFKQDHLSYVGKKEQNILCISFALLIKFTLTSALSPLTFKTTQGTRILWLVSRANHLYCSCNQKTQLFPLKQRPNHRIPFVTFILVYCNPLVLNLKNITNVPV